MYKDLEEVLDGKYKDKNMVEEDIGIDETFHPNGVVQTIAKEDDWFLGYRGNHFIIIDGYYEECPNRGAFIFMCNHKGTLIIKSFVEYLAI